MLTRFLPSCARFGFFVAILFLSHHASAVIRDGGIDPANLGKGEWIYSVKDATNRLGGHISSVTNEVSLFKYYQSIGVRYVIIKMGTGSTNYGGCYASPHQVTANLCNIARTNGVLVFGYTRSYGSDIVGESALADSCFNNGADGFVFDAEAEWESSRSWIGNNGPTLAWDMCSMVRSNWPTKFLGHAPFPIISFHSSFPYKEFGYWCDAVMPQVYHLSTAGLKGSPSAVMNWTDVNYRSWQNSLIGTSSNINGQTIYWTNSIKPIVPVQDVYGEAGNAVGRCNGTAGAQPDNDVIEFIDYVMADPNTATVGGYRGANFWRADLHGTNQFTNIAAGTSGTFSGVVNNIVIDDADATVSGAWTAVKVFGATTTAPTYYGETTTDIDPFGTNYWRKGQGTGTNYIEFRPQVLTEGDYSVFQWHPFRSDASAGVPFVIRSAGQTNTVFANQQTNNGSWSFLGKFPFAAGTNGTIRVLDNFAEAGAVALVDGLKLVFDQQPPPTSIPAKPSGLTASAVSSSQINLVWSDQATNEAGYVVDRGTASGGPYATIAIVGRNITNYSNTGLLADTPYYYVVKGTNSLGVSPTSSQASATTFLPTAPIINTQPQNQVTSVGIAVSFNVAASGSTPLFYQWRFNTTNIAGATASSFTKNSPQPSDAGNYSVIVSNSVNVVTSSNATLTVMVVPPSISSQPTNQTAWIGSSPAFTVSASGPGTLRYQWRFGGVNLSGATTSTLVRNNVTTNNTGNYDVIITNASGSVTSQIAILTVIVPPPNVRFLPLWNLAANSRSYLTNTGTTERGLAYNPFSDRLLVVGRVGTPQVYVLQSTNGADLHKLSLGSGIISGGTYTMSMVGIADDGVVYVANLVLNTAPATFKIYRWANDNLGTTPTVAFSGDPAPGNAQRWGDALDVRGAGTNTQIIITSRSGANVAVLTTSDGITFNSTAFNVAGVPAGAFGLGVAFGDGNTFWGKAAGQPLRKVSFNLSTGASSVLQTDGSPGMANSIGPIGASPALNVLAGIAIETPDNLKLYDTTNGTMSLVETNSFPSDNDNSNQTGSVDFGGDRVFALDANNGILAMRVLPPSGGAPVRFSFVSRQDQGLRLQMTGQPGKYLIEGTIDFTNWSGVANVTNTNGVFEFTDPQTNLPNRFYRTRSNP